MKCFYCGEIYATVGCEVATCLKTYHLPCGIKHGAINEYYGDFLSYCCDHRSKHNRSNNPKDYVLTAAGLVPSNEDKGGKLTRKRTKIVKEMPQ